MDASGEELSDLEVENEENHCGFEEEPETIAIMDAVKVLLQGLGEDINREGIRKTPFRVAKALREGTRGYRQTAKDIIQSALFPEAGLHNSVGQAGGAGGIVIVRDLDFFSYCESCLLPFQVKCHVGYVPSGQRVVGLSKLFRVADVFAKRLQKPQRLADQICSALHHAIKPGGVAVVLNCMHIHFPSLESVFLDSKSSGWIKLHVQSGSGAFESQDADAWMDFFSLLKLRGSDLRKACASNAQVWCPSHFPCASKFSTKIESTNPRMTSAVTSILKSLGEDPSRKELLGTPGHFVNWLMNFQNCNVDMKTDMKKLNGFANGRTHLEHENGNLSDKQIQSEINFLFWSQCEHHLLPFYGVVHIGFLRADGLVPFEKSLLNSVILFYGLKLQVQERMTRQIAETVSSLVGADVIVVVEASHTCMISRGIEKFGSTTATIAALGWFSSNAAARAMFLQSIPKATIGEL
ncbi:GTP cyclohydrolase 1 isoform X1 [Cucurbita maxima]|uniref:GTP cyclohydrolase 1 n=1 Tax=Cucurbita maxima TaxID=3661 RepID=A0A6J1KVE1_CUCMA|nr:GTP cyclohydrolase 1 isoform X1 [Cucurbita maxima]